MPKKTEEKPIEMEFSMWQWKTDDEIDKFIRWLLIMRGLDEEFITKVLRKHYEDFEKLIKKPKK